KQTLYNEREKDDYRSLDCPGAASTGVSDGRTYEELYARGETPENYDLGRASPSRAGALYWHRRNPGCTRTHPAEAHEHSPSVDDCSSHRTYPGDGERGGVPYCTQRIQPHRYEYRAAIAGSFYCGWVSGLGPGRVASYIKS